MCSWWIQIFSIFSQNPKSGWGKNFWDKKKQKKVFFDLILGAAACQKNEKRAGGGGKWGFYKGGLFFLIFVFRFALGGNFGVGFPLKFRRIWGKF